MVHLLMNIKISNSDDQLSLKVISKTMEVLSIFSNAYILSKCEKPHEVNKLIQLKDTLRENKSNDVQIS